MFIRMIDEDHHEVWVNKNFIMAFEPSSLKEFKNYFRARVYGGNGLYKFYYMLQKNIMDVLAHDDESMNLIRDITAKEAQNDLRAT